MTGVGLGWVGRSRRLLAHFSMDQAVEGAGSRAEPAAQHDLWLQLGSISQRFYSHL